jgi:hypothetical protein
MSDHIPGAPTPSRSYADTLKSMRRQLPTVVKDILTEVESHGGETCAYHTIVPRLLNAIDWMRSEESKFMDGPPTWPWAEPDSEDIIRTGQLISVIESAYRAGVPISRPYTVEEDRVIRDAEEEYEEARVQRMDEANMVMNQREERRQEWIRLHGRPGVNYDDFSDELFESDSEYSDSEEYMTMIADALKYDPNRPF